LDTDTNPPGRPWFADPDLDVLSAQILRVDLAQPNLEPLATYLADHIKQDPPEKRIELFGDALFDLSRLLEEYAYGAAVAATYLKATEEARRDLHTKQLQGLKAVPMTSIIRALLSPYSGFLPMPSTLISEPTVPAPGLRILGGWWAGQLIDSAILRGLSSLDRVATILFLVADQPINETKMPAFRPEELRKLRNSYEGEDWESLRELTHHELFLFVKDYRDGFIHRQRKPMQLHGDHTTFGADGTIYQGIEASMHFALLGAFHEHVIRPACELAGRLVGVAKTGDSGQAKTAASD